MTARPYMAVPCGNPDCAAIDTNPHCDNPECTWRICTICRSFGQPGDTWGFPYGIPHMSLPVGASPKSFPAAPCAAYTAVVGLLPKDWLDHAPPVTGVSVTVAGADNLNVTFDLDVKVAAELDSLLSRRPPLRVVTMRSYDHRGDPTLDVDCPAGRTSAPQGRTEF